ncbi:NAD(P)-binding protein [Panus rudis PR-1116 ss-1]|nr:NAD(P)-binding protein [Panus rudis PR-1116 ss-1]
MRVLVLGATGPSGIDTVREFFKVYPSGSVVIYARNPSKLPVDISSNPAVTVVIGQLTDTEALSRAFSSGGQVNAVLSTLGAALRPERDDIITQAYRTLMPIMEKHNCKRLIVLSTISVTIEQDHFSLLAWLSVLLIRLVMPKAYRDVNSWSRLLRDEGHKYGIDWTAVRVPWLHNKPGQKVKAGYVGDGTVGVTLSRLALAEFFVAQIEGKEWVGKMLAISSG